MANYQDIINFVRDVTLIATREEDDFSLSVLSAIEWAESVVSGITNDEKTTIII